MMLEKKYNPNMAIHPGRTLQDILETINMSQVDLAERTGLTPKTINEIIQEKNSITPDTAIKLSAVFGMSATFWNNLERNYEEVLARLKEEEKLKEELPYLKKFICYNELVKWHYIKRTKNAKEKITNLLNFFSVSSLGIIPKISEVAYRKCKHTSLSNESLAAWLRCGELDAQKTKTQKFDKEKIIGSIEKLRLLTKEEPRVFQKKLIEICSSFGVTVVFTPYFKNTYVNGATRWVNSEKAMIQLNLRGGYSDIFWFTFFHELAHILKHGKKEQFIEFEKKGNGDELMKKEKEADDFASDTLIPKLEYQEFINRGGISVATINIFANKSNISPGIVAGRLAHNSGFWKKLSRLRTRLKFEVKIKDI